MCSAEGEEAGGTPLSQPRPAFVSPSCDCVHAVSGGCQGYGLLSPDAPAEKRAGVYPCLCCVPLKSVKDFIKIVQRGGWWPRWSLLPVEMVGPALCPGIFPEHEHP